MAIDTSPPPLCVWEEPPPRGLVTDEEVAAMRPAAYDYDALIARSPGDEVVRRRARLLDPDRAL